jgi:hypothetical protein
LGETSALELLNWAVFAVFVQGGSASEDRGNGDGGWACDAPACEERKFGVGSIYSSLSECGGNGAITGIAAASGREGGLRRRGSFRECICSLETDADGEGLFPL